LAIVSSDSRGGSRPRPVRGVSGHLESLVGSNEGKAMHRVHLFCLRRRQLCIT
jgi:hypothetical protein